MRISISMKVFVLRQVCYFVGVPFGISSNSYTEILRVCNCKNSKVYFYARGLRVRMHYQNCHNLSRSQQEFFPACIGMFNCLNNIFLFKIIAYARTTFRAVAKTYSHNDVIRVFKN